MDRTLLLTLIYIIVIIIPMLAYAVVDENRQRKEIQHSDGKVDFDEN